MKLRTLQLTVLAGTLVVSTLPAVGQPVYQYDTPGGWSRGDEHRAEHAARDEHRADHAAQESERQLDHGGRDAAVGDYHGAAHALRRAQQAEMEARRHGGYSDRRPDQEYTGHSRHD